jgi:hypothetical protein
VAIKVALPEIAAQPRYAATYLAEALTVAGLDHPKYRPLYDVGLTEDGLPFVVAKYIESSDLDCEEGTPQIKGERTTPLAVSGSFVTR